MTQKLRRDDPNRKRTLKTAIGSEHEIGKELLEVLLDDDPSAQVVYTEGQLWEYIPSQGIWQAIPEDELHRIIGSFDGSEYDDGKNIRTLRISHMFATGAIQRAEIQVSSPNHFTHAAPLLVFSDCVVQLGAAGEIEQKPHSPDVLARAGYPFVYNPNAKAPKFKKMLKEHFAGDEDAPEKIAALQEFFGVCLFGIATRFQKCLALPSEGGSGRSTMLEIIEKAMPRDSVAHVDAKELRSPERRAKLPGKLLNFSDEVPPDAFLESEDFKKLVVGNVVSAEEKYKPSFEFRPVGGFVFPIQVSASAELSDAFFRRFIIIRYRHNFEGSAKRNMNLAAEIIRSELAGVVAWMIEGAARRLKRTTYTTPASHVEEENKWKLAADTVRTFLNTQYAKSLFKEPRSKGYDDIGRATGEPKEQHDWTPGGVLYGEYQDWCGANGHRKPVASPEFKRRVEKIGYLQVHTRNGSFYGVRSLEKAQELANSTAKKAGRAAKIVPGAVDAVRPNPLKIVT